MMSFILYSSYNKYAFQYDASQPLVDRMLESASQVGGGFRGVCYQGGLVLGGCLLPGGSPYQGGGVSLQGGSPCPGSLLARGGSPCQRPPLWTESQMPVKTLPWPNFVAAGNNNQQNGCNEFTIQELQQKLNTNEIGSFINLNMMPAILDYYCFINQDKDWQGKLNTISY